MTTDDLKKLCDEAMERAERLRTVDTNVGLPHRPSREALLARALLALMPFVFHRQGCNAWTTARVADGRRVPLPCDCGLDAALSALGEKEKTDV